MKKWQRFGLWPKILNFFLDVKNMLKTFRKHFGPLWDGTKFLKAIKCDVNVKNSIFNNTMYKPFKTCSKGLQNQNGPFLRNKCKIWTWVFRGLKYLSLRSFSEKMMKIVEASFLIGQFLYITAVYTLLRTTKTQIAQSGT